MKIPQNLQAHFAHATLILACDHIKANFFLAGGDELEELDGISLPREFRSDSEGSFTSSDGSRVAGPDADIDDTPRLQHFIKRVADQTSALVRKHDIQNIYTVLPADLDHLLSAQLLQDIAAKRVRTLHLDLMKENPLTILKRIFEG